MIFEISTTDSSNIIYNKYMDVYRINSRHNEIRMTLGDYNGKPDFGNLIIIWEE